MLSTSIGPNLQTGRWQDATCLCALCAPSCTAIGCPSWRSCWCSWEACHAQTSGAPACVELCTCCCWGTQQQVRLLELCCNKLLYTRQGVRLTRAIDSATSMHMLYARLCTDTIVQLIAGKSAMLHWAAKVAGHAVETSGRGASQAGLMASAVKDPTSNAWGLEAGAFVLADGGLCCLVSSISCLPCAL